MGAVDLASRIVQYRVGAGLSQQDLAHAIGMDRTALAKIETGTRRVSAVELSSLAEALHVRMDWFFTDPAPAIVAYRESAPEQIRASIDVWVERLAREVAFVRDSDRNPWPDLRIDRNPLDAERLAERARSASNLSADEPVRDIAKMFSELGVLTFSIDLGTDAPDGASAAGDGFGVAVVNAERAVGRRRLTAAHELGHLLTSDTYQVDWRVDEPDPDREEAELDRFARALLLPAGAMTKRWAPVGTDDFDERAEALRTASEYQVDMATLARRLTTLKLVDHVTAGRIRSYRHTKPDFIELDLVKRSDLEAGSLPASYERAVLSMYRADKISADRALDLLLGSYDEADLPQLDPLPDGAMWALL